MEFNTAGFGTITVEESEIITFPSGILGFADHKRYALLEMVECPPFKWLQSMEEDGLAFVLLDPFDLLDDYEIEMDANSVTELDLRSPEEARVYVVVTVADNPRETTANLQAPIILNPTHRLAKQIVLMNSPYEIRHRILGDF